MYTRFFLALAAFTVFGGAMNAQNQQRRMTPMGGGAPDRGKCTVEVVVDGAAEVEIHGNTANLRNLSGSQPQWRRFECTGPLPRNPGDFRFTGIDGRGRQQLIRDPRRGGSAVIRIEDPDNGAEGYTFDIMWGNAEPFQGRQEERGFDRQGSHRPDDRRPGSERDSDAFYRGREDAFRGENWRMSLFTRIREDLDHVQSVTFPVGSDQYRIARAKQQLDELQALQARGRYDRRELNDVVVALRRVVRDNRLAPRDRDVLNDDLNRLQHFRGHARDYGIR